MAVLSYCSPAFGGGTIHNQIGIKILNITIIAKGGSKPPPYNAWYMHSPKAKNTKQ